MGAYDSNPMMSPDQPEADAPQGGLASKAIGGLSTFLGNVNRGVDAVLSHPLYAKAWSGMVSGMTGDPMAGPFALQQLQQGAFQQNYQARQMQREEEAYTTEKQNAMLRAKQIRDMQRAMAANDPAGVRAALSGFAPTKAAEMFLAPPASAKPVQVLKDGVGVWETPQNAIGMPTVPKGPLVENNIGGMKTEQVIAAEDRAAGRVDSKAQPLETALDAYRSFRALAEQVITRGTPPTPAETDSLAKLAARLENPEAVQEGDIARKAGGSFANFFAGKAGLPYTLNLDQLSGLVSTADTIAAVKQRRLDEIYSGAKGVAQGRGFNPDAVTPGAQQIGSPQEQPPAGFRPHPTVPGLFVNDAGEGWVP